MKRHGIVAADWEGRIWFGLTHGLSVADPARADRRESASLTTIEQITADGVALDPHNPAQIPSEPPAARVHLPGFEPGRPRARPVSVPPRRLRHRMERSGAGAAGRLYESRSGTVSVPSRRIEQRRCLERSGSVGAVRNPADVLADRLVPGVRLRRAPVCRPGASIACGYDRWPDGSAFDSKSVSPSERTSRRSSTIPCCRVSSARPCSCTSLSIGCPMTRPKSPRWRVCSI